jgi:type I restriction enzyme S subunit
MALVRDDDPIFVANPGVTVWRSLNNAELDYRFLYYRMHAMDFLHQVWAVAGSTDTFPYVSLTQQKKLSLTLPPHKDQVCIGQILGLLDEKIDLNRRMNETLEAMARAIFKDWFVDFGPTRAKMEGQAPYLAPDLWALFPDRLNDEGKPVGWRNCKLLDLCELKRGYDLPTAERRPGPFPIISSSGVSGLHDRGMAKHPGVVTGRYGTIGEVFFLDEDFWPLNTALYVRDFKGNDQRYVYYTIRAIDFGIYSDKGAVPGINRNHLHAHIVLWAPLDVQRAFRDVLESSWTRQRVNRSESETLAATRDLLLPKLMSGELRVRDAEKLAEAVM